jgi:glycosyltransferase involved in cell wall biosynthesis
MAAPRRVVMTTRYPLNHPGGVERVVHALTQRLGAGSQGWRAVHVAAYRARVGPARVPLLGDLVAAIRLAARTATGADAVIVHGAEYAWGPLAIGKLTKRPTVVVWHGVRGWEALPPARNRLELAGQRLFYWTGDLLQQIALRADATVVVGPGVAQEVRARFAFRGELHIVPNGVEPGIDDEVDGRSYQPTTPVAGEVGRREGGGAPLRVIWIGTAPYKKGLDLALAACREARAQGQELTLTVVGVSREQAGLGAASPVPWVSWLGRISPTEVDASLFSHDVLLHPARYEACCMVVLEALAAGLPVVGSTAVGWQIGDAGEVVAGLDPSSYSQALCRLADPEHRRKLEGAARARARLFSWEQAAASYVSVLEGVWISRKSGRRHAGHPSTRGA